MRHWAARIAQTVPPRDVGDLDDATLVLNYLVRRMLLSFANNPEYQAIVDNNVGELIFEPNRICWVNSAAGVWLPLSEGTARQIHFSLIERYKQAYFAQHCWAELERRNPRDEVEKYTFVLLTNFDEFRQQREEADQWLRDKSRCIDPDVGEDAMHDWLEKLLGFPVHIQIKKIGATRKAIRDRSIDMRRKGGKYEHVALDASINPIIDQSLEAPDKEIIDDEYIQRFLANQQQIEEILGGDSVAIGKRRFKVMQMLTHTPNLNSSQIAKQLRVSKQTIGRDRNAIKQNWKRIQEILHG
jgi:hypothetical protein